MRPTAFFLGVICTVLLLALWYCAASAQVVLTEDACLTRAIITMPSGDITIDATAGGIQVLAANAKRCNALIINGGNAALRGCPSWITVSASVGVTLGAGQSLPLDRDGRAAWRCIRTTGTSTSATIIESAVP